MEKTKPEKQFDAVKMMREIRAKISSETQNMTFDELKAHIKQKLTDNKSKLVGKNQGKINPTYRNPLLIAEMKKRIVTTNYK